MSTRFVIILIIAAAAGLLARLLDAPLYGVFIVGATVGIVAAIVD